MGELWTQREDWARKAGPFYPVLVAVGLQTALPVRRTLHSSPSDDSEARMWLPLVGLAVGVLWAFVGAIGVELGLSGMVTGVLVTAASVLMGAGLFEHAAGSLAAGGLERWQRQAGEGSSDRIFAVAVVACLLILLRVGAIASIEASELTRTLIGAAVASRWLMGLQGLFARHTGSQRFSERGWLPIAVGAASTLLVVGLSLGLGGIVLLVLATLVLWALERFERMPSGLDGERALLAYALLVELVILL